LGIKFLTYMPVRPENLSDLEFDKHLFVRAEPGATSTLELDSDEVKNDNDVGFDIPVRLASRIGPDEVAHGLLAFGSAVKIDKQPPRPVANMLRCDAVAIFTEHF
jgi:hypothetical protein